jgi:ATP-binding cassette subfamily C protein
MEPALNIRPAATHGATPQSSLREMLAPCRGALIGVTAISGLINVLYLTGSFFMLEVYDRVIPSRSMPTLVALGVIALVLYIFQGLLDFIRGRIFIRMGVFLDQALGGRVYDAILHLSAAQRKTDPLQPSRDLDQVRSFLWSGGPVAFLDLPWMPIYIAICFMFHFWIGVTAIAGALILIVLTRLTETGALNASKAANTSAAARAAIGEASRRNAEVLQVLGMGPRIKARWQKANASLLIQSGRASDIVLGFGATSKVMRTALQSFVLALGAYLVIQQEATGGIMIASSILVARGLAPIEMVISQWKGFVAARQSWHRLHDVLSHLPAGAPMPLPPPFKTLSVQDVSLVPPGGQVATVLDVAFDLEKGSALGIIGSSASGKSSLARAIVGVWQPVKGAIRLDGASIASWLPERLGDHIGYMPQDVELFAGSVAENISRFNAEATSDQIIAAAEAAGIHRMILNLPHGYDTQIGEDGRVLSAGQKQRVALARALFGAPFLVVLDEPNSNLDAEGDAALTQAILGVRARGGIVIIIAHRPSAIAACNLLMAMVAGRCHMIGPKDEVLAAVTRPVTPAVQFQGAKAKV